MVMSRFACTKLYTNYGLTRPSLKNYQEKAISSMQSRFMKLGNIDRSSVDVGAVDREKIVKCLGLCTKSLPHRP